MPTRAIVTLPPPARPGELVELRVLVSHPMETGYRRDAEGRLLPRELIRRFRCRCDGDTVVEAELHAAVAANPYLAFWLRVGEGPGLLEFEWEGDNGFVHRERRTLQRA